MRAVTADSRFTGIRIVVSAIAAVLVMSAGGCTGSAPSRAPIETGAAAAESAGSREPESAEAVTPAGDEEPQELSDEIYFDDQGAAYRRLRIPKEEGRYKRVGDDRLQIPYGLLFYLAEETEDAFYVKLFTPPEELAEAELPAPPASTADEPAPVMAVVTPAASDRLRFEPFDRGLPSRGQWRNGFDIGDVNGDGFLDIVHGPPRKGASVPHVFLGHGQGDWRYWREASFAGLALDYGDAEAADFNGDGIMDLAFAVHLRGLAVFVGDGKGGFKLWSDGLEYAAPEAHQGTASFSSRAITSADWNGDGRVDLLALGEGPSLGRPTAGSQGSPSFQSGARGPVVYLNQGDGTWRPHAPRGEGREPFGDSLATGDFDGDGFLDLVTATNGYGAVGIVHLGQPDGTWRRADVEALGEHTLVKAVAAADLDGDGRDQVVAGTLTFVEGQSFISGLAVLDLQPDGTWTREVLVSAERQLGIWGVAAGDIDGDGRVDLVAASGFGELWVLLGTGDGGFRRETSDELRPPGYLCRGYHVELADLDGEPGDEMIVAFAGEPGSEQLIPGLEKHCPEEGALKVWKALARD